MTGPDSRDIVRHGYDAVSHLYRGDSDDPAEYAPWLATLRRRLPSHASVLDVGCGCGIPVAKALAEAGYDVTGVDISQVQINRARQLVPSATFLHADATQITFPEAVFDGIICLYTLIHMPREDQPHLICRMANWLRTGGLLLVTTGAQAWTGVEDNWLGGTATMWWSHTDTDTDTYREWIIKAGLQIDSEEFVPEGNSGHSLFWTHRAAP